MARSNSLPIIMAVGAAAFFLTRKNGVPVGGESTCKAGGWCPSIEGVPNYHCASGSLDNLGYPASRCGSCEHYGSRDDSGGRRQVCELYAVDINSTCVCDSWATAY